MQLALRSVGPHQVAYEAAASPLHVKIVWAVYITFYTTIANYNEPSAAAQAHIHIATHIIVSKYS